MMKIATHICLILPVFAVCCFTATLNAEDKVPAANAVQTKSADDGRAWATQGRLYAVIATDDNLAGTAGRIAHKNGAVIEKLFDKNVASGAYSVIKVPKNLITRQGLLAAVANLRVTAQDAVVIYISAQGGYDRKNGAYYTLSKSKEDLYRSEVRNALAKKNVRLSVLLSDNIDGKVIPNKPEPAKEEKGGKKKETKSIKFAGADMVLIEEIDVDTAATDTKFAAKTEVKTTSPLFFSLFFNSKGTVDIQSALPGQFSLPTENGIGAFTESLTGLVRGNRRKSLSWYRLFPYIKKGTALTFENIYPDGSDVEKNGSVQKTQTPLLLTLYKNNDTSGNFGKVYPNGNKFDALIAGAKDNDAKLSDADRKQIQDLIAETVQSVRPQNDDEKGTHEDFVSLDPDNTVNGVNEQPFGVELPRVEPAAARRDSKDTGGSETAARSGNNDKQRFGVRAATFVSGGVEVLEVLTGSVGAKAGLKQGYIILTIDGKKILDEDDYSKAIDGAGETIEIEFRDKNGVNKNKVEFK
ncbi:MAG: PDZ domain-containing protein [Planctomycetaceae bacterium]|jgi:hypothetical protein|nr:PDZ domain-containing protein [Planctomycetaceae bacterium]